MNKEFTTFLNGHFVVAVPDMLDPNFAGTVTCMCEHTKESAMGVVINRPHGTLKLKDIYAELSMECIPHIAKMPVYIGGPVQTNYIFVIHDEPFDWGSCLKITDSLAMSNSMDIINAISQGEGPESFIIALGAAGWGSGQLEAEIIACTWLTCPVDNDLIFNSPADETWEKVMNVMGVDPLMLSNTAGNA